MPDRSDDIMRRASDDRFRDRRTDLVTQLRSLVGPLGAPEPLASADRAAALVARAAYHTGEAEAWAVVRREWQSDDRGAVVRVLHAIRAVLGPRPVWLILPGREPQVVPIVSDVVLDNPLGFVALGDYEFTLLDQAAAAGLTLTRHSHISGSGQTTYSWEVEAWGTEPWLSAMTRALREGQGESGEPSG